LQVRASPRRAAGRGGAGPETAEEFLEEIPQSPESAREAFRHPSFDPGMAKAVVSHPSLFVGKDAVGLAHLFECLLGAWILIDVGVVPLGEGPIGIADLLGSGAARHPEDFVVVPAMSCHRGGS